MKIGFVIVALLVLIFLINSQSCSSRKANKERSVADTGINEDEQKAYFNKKFLEGVWWIDANSVSALFFITKDTLYYTEQQEKPYAITIKGDTLSLNGENFVSFFRIKKLTKDSLVFYDYSINEDIKLFKRMK